ncbi:MAG: hypothetical protein QF415_16830 [Candidatus Undinarchaeales archaeon]|jgi:hypothetical protein|nr:hypothetical protein [Candidatus Undinarchaeales archaeon]MDP7494450.1 hypothetical protein [Candidatus Undinarchaeales archaeon]
MRKIELPRQHVMALLNELYYSNQRDLKVKELLGGRELFTITLGEECTVRLKWSGWEDAPAHREIPVAEDLREALRASGVVRPKEWDELEKIIKEMAKRDLRTNPPVYICFDTNCLSRRLYDSILPVVEKKEKKGARSLGFVLSKAVRKELFKFDKKYRDVDLAELKRTGVPEWLANDLHNQLNLAGRKTRLGFEEYGQVKSRAVEVSAEEDGDIGIISSLERFRESRPERQPDLLVLSSDNDVCARAEGPGVRPFLVDYRGQDRASSYKCDWESAARLLYVASVIFARISVRAGGTVEVAGVWRGKGLNEWKAEKVRLTVHGDELSASLEQTLAILGPA